MKYTLVQEEKGLTQHEKVFGLMISRANKQEWFCMTDFQRPNMSRRLFIGYKAPARVNELEIEYEGLFLYKDMGKYRYRKIDRVKFIKIMEQMPEKLRMFCKSEIAKLKANK